MARVNQNAGPKQSIARRIDDIEKRIDRWEARLEGIVLTFRTVSFLVVLALSLFALDQIFRG